MELEEIQATWAQMGRELEKQKRLTNEIIVQMTQQRYSGRFDRISTYETIGAALCFAVVVLILANFGKLDTWYLKACGVFNPCRSADSAGIGLAVPWAAKTVGHCGKALCRDRGALCKDKKALDGHAAVQCVHQFCPDVCYDGSFHQDYIR